LSSAEPGRPSGSSWMVGSRPLAGWPGTR